MNDILFEVKNLEVFYDNKKIINGIDISLKKSELTALLGLNGAGKTTILKAICGLLSFKSDIYKVCGQDIRNLNAKKKAQYISYVPQKCNFIHNISVLDVVLMGFNPHLKFMQFPSNKQKNLAKQVLDSLGLKNKIYEDYQSLSGGQQQLVILARTIVQQAPVMFFDEPNSALDYPNHHMILEKIRNILMKNNFCGLITLHDPNYALAYCDKILILNDGKISNFIDTKKDSRETIKKKLSEIYSDIEVITYKNQYYVVKEVLNGKNIKN
jgi:iron complex transport system ATP-binding protein